MADTLALRAGPLEALASTSVPCPAAELSALEPAAKFIFRARPASFAAAGSALGVTLPQTACRAETQGDRAALWLGPDEFLLIAPLADEADITESIATTLAGIPHALVAAGHRNAGIAINGEKAAMVLNAGCPLDLDLEVFPVGMCTRTILGKAEIVLWRTGATMFRIEVWRSFASYVWQFLDEARGEFR